MSGEKDNKNILESLKLIKCGFCSSEGFVYGDHASTKITIHGDGEVEYGDCTHTGEVEYVRCASCGKELPKWIWEKMKW